MPLEMLSPSAAERAQRGPSSYGQGLRSKEGLLPASAGFRCPLLTAEFFAFGLPVSH